MLDRPDADAYVERAEMHEMLAANTADEPARKMHQAMAAEYRRKAGEAGGTPIPPPILPMPQSDAASRLMATAGY